jgi:hypothetical protein
VTLHLRGEGCDSGGLDSDFGPPTQGSQNRLYRSTCDHGGEEREKERKRERQNVRTGRRGTVQAEVRRIKDTHIIELQLQY